VKEAWEGAKRRTRRHCPACKDGLLAEAEKPTKGTIEEDVATVKKQKGYVCESCHWETAELPAALSAVRFHDLRHTAVSRMISARVPLPIIAKIVGWSAGTMAKMAARYGHFGMEELRGAVEAISSPQIVAGSPQFSPQLQTESGTRNAN